MDVPRRKTLTDWRTIEEFPKYVINEEGLVANKETSLPVKPRLNQRGALMIGLIKGKGSRGNEGQQTRSLAVLVANTFLGPPDPEWFDTVLHRDGDRTHVHVRNLLWRPRWFVIEYHKQFDKYGDYDDWRAPIRHVESGAVFANPREVAMEYGLLEREVMLDLVNQRGVFPGGHLFVYADD